MCKEIPLTNGYKAVVDDEDYEMLNQWTWRALERRRTVYAYRNAYVNGKRRPIYMHREIAQPGESLQVDHIDHDGLNNCRSNLRVCTSKQNSYNTRKTRSTTASRFKGVKYYKDRGKWVASIIRDGTSRYLGAYDTEREAAEMYDAYAARLSGEYAFVNMPGSVNLDATANVKVKTSDYRGVSWASKPEKWKAEIYIGGKYKYLGYFTSESEAAGAYNRAAIELLGFDKALPKLNIIFDGLVLDLESRTFRTVSNNFRTI